jgi:hypothetical protein
MMRPIPQRLPGWGGSAWQGLATALLLSGLAWGVGGALLWLGFGLRSCGIGVN